MKAGTIVCALFVCSWCGSRLHAQDTDSRACTADSVLPIVDLTDEWATRLRTRQLQAEAPLSALTIRRPSSDRRMVACRLAAGDTTGTPRTTSLRMLPVRVRTIHNSGYPLDVNNGAVWAGRGASSTASAGAELRFGPFSAAVYPVFSYQQNDTFRLAVVARSRSPFSYPWHTIDWPQRQGDESFVTFDPGQSHARIDAYGATAGVSTENLWLGPALRMPLLMSNSAPGFPHVFAGTARPRNIGIGTLAVELFWGRLSESEYFDADTANDHTFIAGFAAVVEPAFARGLFLGVNRMYLTPMTEGTSLFEYLLDPYTDVRDNTGNENQLLSVYARWVHPSAGFEAYAEWARDDHWADFWDLSREPDHSQAYLLGFQKTGRLRGATLRWFGELAHLDAAQTMRGGRGVVTFYTHGGVVQGFTHRGQLLGAWIGPGSNAQVLGVERSDARRITSLMLERVRFDADAYYNQWARFYGQNGHDLSLGGTLRHVEWLGPLSVHAALTRARRENRNFANHNDIHPGWFIIEHNTQLDIEARWTPGGRR